jgi:hypothetical protein
MNELWTHLFGTEYSLESFLNVTEFTQSLFFNAGHRDLHDKNFGSC